jgi:hypothetical protein
MNDPVDCALMKEVSTKEVSTDGVLSNLLLLLDDDKDQSKAVCFLNNESETDCGFIFIPIKSDEFVGFPKLLQSVEDVKEAVSPELLLNEEDNESPIDRVPK